jgi:hypothetical protein
MGAVMEAALERALHDDGAWADLVEGRREQLRQFLWWAAACEAGTRKTSLRLENRDDIVRCREVVDMFDEPWWAIVIYSCFDSTTGTRVAAPHFRTAMSPIDAERALVGLDFPRGSVQHHRAQSTLTGARRSLVSACDKANDIEIVLREIGVAFDLRFARLRKLRVSWWGRTTCFDVLLRAGAIGVSGETYRPDKAYLRGSQGPAAGFERLWGLYVTASNADLCEELLRRWSQRWDEVASTLGVRWEGQAYDSADFENALCVFQERPGRGMPDPGTFAVR